MRVVKGTTIRDVDVTEFQMWRSGYREVTLDLGAGDGHYARWLAQRHPSPAVVGVDLCAANLRRTSRSSPANTLFVIADATALPAALRGAANRVTINFPRGSLLHGLLDGHPGLLAALAASSCRETTLEIRLNAGALAEAGWPLDSGGARVAAILRQAGYLVDRPAPLTAAELCRLPTTWAKRLAVGRDPRAIALTAMLPQRR